jgi:hypothetical protein
MPPLRIFRQLASIVFIALILCSVTLAPGQESSEVRLTLGDASDTPAAAPSTAEVKRVAIYRDGGVTGKGVPRLKEIFGRRSEVRVAELTGDDIRAGALDQFDVCIFSGGSGSAQAASFRKRDASKCGGLSSEAACSSASAPARTWRATASRGG